MDSQRKLPTSPSSTDGLPVTAVAKPDAEFPGYPTPLTKALEETRGPFNYEVDAPLASELAGLEFKIILYDNGAYQGQCNKEGL